MNKMSNLNKEVMDMLLTTSRTFYIPISRLTPNIKEAVASAYLCMRAIDEIEDHTKLPSETKIKLLHSVSEQLDNFEQADFESLFAPYQFQLPEVTLRMKDWAEFAPTTIQKNILYWTSIMAKGMAEWVEKNWVIQTEEDLDSYTYYVAGLVGVLLNEIWTWYDGTRADHDLAMAYGRGLQAVNIIRNRKEDLERGVDFFPDGWGYPEMFAYAKRNLKQADTYVAALDKGPILDFCKIPLALAHATLRTIELGKTKLSRSAVIHIVEKLKK